VNDNYGYDTKFISTSATGNMYKQLHIHKTNTQSVNQSC